MTPCCSCPACAECNKYRPLCRLQLLSVLASAHDPCTLRLVAPMPCLPQAASDALAAREAAVASQQSSLQAELDALLAKQEERLRAWEGGCADLEAQLEKRQAALAAEEQR